MSLRVWLPLNGTLDNQGLDQVTVINNGATVDNNGKIGKCYSFDGNDDYISLNGNALYNIIKGGSNPFSFTMWIYHADNSRAILFGDYSLSGSINFNIELNASHSVRFYWAGAPDTSGGHTLVTQGGWTHIAIVYNGADIKFYKNGILTDTYVGTLTIKNKNSGDYYLGRDVRTGTTALNGKLNDVRIYDHALSPLEVKHIAQGLILHYPLNRGGWGQENLLKVNCCRGGNRATFLENGRRVKINWTSNAGDTYWYLDLASGVTLTEGKTYTLSFQCSGLGSNVVSFRWCNLANYEVYLKKGLNTFTFAMPSTNINNPFFDDINRDPNLSDLELWNFKLEEGSIATPWCPNSSDALATTMGLNDIVEYDTSGYCNNGTRKGTSRFSWTSDTPKYSVSQIFSGIHRIEAPFNPGNSPTFTVAGWFYHTGGTTYYGAKNSYNTFICLEGGRYFVYNSTGSAYVGYWTSTANTWQHVVLVHDAVTAKLKLYINGNFVSEVTTNGTIYGSDILDIGGRQGAAQYSGKMSDFRIYATALSADDVKSLYQNSAYIDNQGNIYGAVYEEV